MNLALIAKIENYIKKENARIWLTIMRPLILVIPGLFLYVFFVHYVDKKSSEILFPYLCMTILSLPLTGIFLASKFDKEKKFINQWKKWHEEKNFRMEISNLLLEFYSELPDDLPIMLSLVVHALVEKGIFSFKKELETHLDNEPKPSKKILKIVNLLE